MSKLPTSLLGGRGQLFQSGGGERPDAEPEAAGEDGRPGDDLQGGLEAAPLLIADAEAARGRSRPRDEARLEPRGGRWLDHARGGVGNVQVDRTLRGPPSGLYTGN